MEAKQSVMAGVVFMILCTGFRAAASGIVRLLSSDIGVFQLFTISWIDPIYLMLPYIARLPSGTITEPPSPFG